MSCLALLLWLAMFVGALFIGELLFGFGPLHGWFVRFVERQMDDEGD